MSNPTHWLLFNAKREVVGCHCGFVAVEEDEGYGDSVVDHLLVVELIEFRAAMASKEDEWHWKPRYLEDLDDWIKSVQDWPVRRFNPLCVPTEIVHAEEPW